MPTLEAHGADVYEKNHTPVSLATGIYSRIELFINRYPNPPTPGDKTKQRIPSKHQSCRFP
jgi:hypothetical protein